MQRLRAEVVAFSTGSGALGGSQRRDDEDLLVVLPTGLPTLSMLGLLLCREAAAWRGRFSRFLSGVCCFVMPAAVLDATSDRASSMSKLSALLMLPVMEGHSLLLQMLPPCSLRRASASKFSSCGMCCAAARSCSCLSVTSSRARKSNLLSALKLAASSLGINICGLYTAASLFVPGCRQNQKL